MKNLNGIIGKLFFYFNASILVFSKPRKTFRILAQDNNQLIAFILVWMSGFAISPYVRMNGNWFWAWIISPLFFVFLNYSSGFLIHRFGRHSGGEAKISQIWVTLAWALIPWLWIIPSCFLFYINTTLFREAGEFICFALVFLLVISPAFLIALGISEVQNFSIKKSFRISFLSYLLSLIPLTIIGIVGYFFILGALFSVHL
jgi:hypothetical protein